MAKHSPGPWIAGSDDDPSEIVAADGTVVAEVGWIDEGADTAVADRNLIAAAPELLAALHAAYAWIGVTEGHFVNRVAGGKAIQADKGAGTLADLAKVIDGALARAECRAMNHAHLNHTSILRPIGELHVAVAALTMGGGKTDVFYIEDSTSGLQVSLTAEAAMRLHRDLGMALGDLAERPMAAPAAHGPGAGE